MAMQNGANIHAVSAANQNALHYSAAVGATSIFNFFVAAGVDPYLEDAYGRTPAMIARTQGFVFDPSAESKLRPLARKPKLLRSTLNAHGKNSDENKTPQHGSDSGGGWDESIFAAEGIKWLLEAGEQCDIYSVEARSFTAIEFIDHVIRLKQPVLIRNALVDDPDGPWPALQEWTQSKLDAILGEY